MRSRWRHQRRCLERLCLPGGLLGTGCPGRPLGPCACAVQSWAGRLSAPSGDSCFLTAGLPERSLSRAGLRPLWGSFRSPLPALPSVLLSGFISPLPHPGVGPPAGRSLSVLHVSARVRQRSRSSRLYFARHCARASGGRELNCGAANGPELLADVPAWPCSSCPRQVGAYAGRDSHVARGALGHLAEQLCEPGSAAVRPEDRRHPRRVSADTHRRLRPCGCGWCLGRWSGRLGV